jgi:hypothetical protein
MARSINEIYSSLIAEKANHTELDGLTSSSSTAIWRLILYIVAVAHYTLEGIQDAFRTEIEDILTTHRVGGLEWYREQALAFQYGDNLVWQNNRWEYAVIDATKQIITRAAAVEAGGTIFLKVAKDNGPLSAPELAAFKNYVKKFKFAGCKVNVISYAADKLSLKLQIWYNAQLIDSDGVLISDGATKPVEAAIIAYNNNLQFNGIVNLTALVDALQAATGVDDAIITEAKAGVAVPLSSISNNNYQTEAGYIELATGLTEISYCDTTGTVVNTVTI